MSAGGGDRAAGRTTLECPCCGDDGCESNDRGEFFDGQSLTCGCPGWVTVEEDGEAWINSGDELCRKCGHGAWQKCTEDQR
jgi:hypothetical protein